METRVIKIEVRGDGDIKELDKQLKKLSKSFNDVDKSSSETGDSTKDSLKGSQAAADRLNGGVAGVAEQFTIVAKAAKKGGLAMKSALISTGIGALIVALGVIVDNWDDIVEFINGANASLERQKGLLEDNASLLDAELKLNSANLKLAKKQGKNTDELILKEKDLLNAKKANLEAQLLILESQLQVEKK